MKTQARRGIDEMTLRRPSQLQTLLSQVTSLALIRERHLSSLCLGSAVTQGAGWGLVSAEKFGYKRSCGPWEVQDRKACSGFLSFVLTSRERGSPTVP